jgi:hypothetical protein
MSEPVLSSLLLYNLAFDKVLREAGQQSYPMKTIVESYANGLTPQAMKLEVKDHKLDALDAAKKIAYDFLKKLEAAQFVVANGVEKEGVTHYRIPAITVPQRGDSHPYHHAIATPRIDFVAPGPAKKTVQCYECGAMGHKQADCPTKAPPAKRFKPSKVVPAGGGRFNANRNNNNNSQRKDNLNITCYNCGEKGHKSPDCVKVKTDNKFAPTTKSATVMVKKEEKSKT